MRPLSRAALLTLLLSGTARAWCPFGMAEIAGSFCVDRFEGSLKEVTASGEQDWPWNQVPAEGKRYKAVSRSRQVPQGYISGQQAAAACAEAGKRLCTAPEWQQACMGPKATTFPYGEAYQKGACNEHYHDKVYVGPYQRLYPKPAYDLKTMNDPRINNLGDTVAASGVFAQCTNDYGVFDMVGNLHEWVSDIKDGKGMFRGGYFNEAEKNGPGCAYKTTAHGFAYHDYSTGFRCCADLPR